MMKQHKRLGSRLPRRLHPLKPRGMSPAFSRGHQLFGGELRVIDENVRAGSQLPQAFIQLFVPRLIVGGVRHGACRRLDAKSQATVWMVQPARADFVLTDLERFPSIYFLKFPLRVHHRHVHGEVRHGHLRFEDLLQAVGPKEL